MANGNGGVRPGAGRKSKAEEFGLAQLMDRSWPKMKRRAFLKKMSELAGEGNVEAGKLLMAYAYGKPTEHHEIGGPDGGALRIIVEHVEDGKRVDAGNTSETP